MLLANVDTSTADDETTTSRVAFVPAPVLHQTANKCYADVCRLHTS